MIVFGFSMVTVVRKRRRLAVHLLARVEPIALGLARGQVETGRRPVFGRAAAGPGIGMAHETQMIAYLEHIKNKVHRRVDRRLVRGWSVGPA